MKKIITIILVLLLSGCANSPISSIIGGVHAEDTDAWIGQTVALLEKHPVFSTLTVVKTRTSDGTELWNFFNGRNASTCQTASGSTTNGHINSEVTQFGRSAEITSGFISSSNYRSFSSCMSTVMACNNIFTIKDGVVLNYSPIGTGGGRCYTNSSVRPNFNGSVNIR